MCYSTLLCQRLIFNWALRLCDTMHKAFRVRKGEIGIVRLSSSMVRLRYPLPNGRLTPRKLQGFPPNYRDVWELSNRRSLRRASATHSRAVGKRNEYQKQLDAKLCWEVELEASGGETMRAHVLSAYHC